MTGVNGWQHWLREPLLHFVVLGFALFWLLHDNATHTAPASGAVIRIDDQQVAALRSQFQRLQQRQPSTGELLALIQDHIEEEALVREARRLGLDQDDEVIRRRLVQKMHFLFQDLDEAAPATAYQQFYLQHLANYRTPASVTFEQIYFTDSPPSLAAFDPAQTGDAFALGRNFTQAAAPAIDKWFGNGFADHLAGMPLHQWQGPLHSVFGFHFVRVSQRQDAVQLPYDQVTEAVMQDYWQEQRTRQRQQSIAHIVAQQPVQMAVSDPALRKGNSTL